LVSGVLNTATSTNGPPLVFVLQARKVAPDVFRATLNTVFVFSGLYAAVIFALRGKISFDEVALSAASVPFLIVGSFVGVLIRRHINEERFRLAVLGLLTVSGLSTLLSAI
ncbi:MAG: TSUP family transporter, partial [Acidobacteria bacterium]|nr:TSUP family transporter [Acidobacteriota bacterium]